MPIVKFVDPFRCRMWQLHDREESFVTEQSCGPEIESFEKHGQLVPALGRPIHGEREYDVELIFGARRLFVARHLNKQLLVELREMSDQDAIVAMDIENRHRADISPYERGLSYARLLRGGHFKTQEDIARTLKVSCSHVSRLLKLARLPSVLLNAFGNPVHIREEWGLHLMDALDEPARREATLRKARAIATSADRPTPADVYRLLIAAATPGRKPRVATHDRVIKGAAGVPLFRVRQQRDFIALLLPVERVSALCLENLCSAVADLLEHQSSLRLVDSVSYQAGCPRSTHSCVAADSGGQVA